MRWFCTPAVSISIKIQETTWLISTEGLEEIQIDFMIDVLFFFINSALKTTWIGVGSNLIFLTVKKRLVKFRRLERLWWQKWIRSWKFFFARTTEKGESFNFRDTGATITSNKQVFKRYGENGKKSFWRLQGIKKFKWGGRCFYSSQQLVAWAIVTSYDKTRITSHLHPIPIV